MTLDKGQEPEKVICQLGATHYTGTHSGACITPGSSNNNEFAHAGFVSKYEIGTYIIGDARSYVSQCDPKICEAVRFLVRHTNSQSEADDLRRRRSQRQFFKCPMAAKYVPETGRVRFDQSSHGYKKHRLCAHDRIGHDAPETLCDILNFFMR